jgi:hypothetical protein
MDAQYISDDCRAFEPSVNEEFITLSTGQYQRLIFM